MPTYLSIILIIVISVLTALGLSEIIRFCEKKITKTPSTIISIIPLSGHVENVEYIIRSILIEHKDANKNSIIIIDLGIDEETKEICNFMSLTNPNISICAKNELSVHIKDQLNIKQ